MMNQYVLCFSKGVANLIHSPVCHLTIIFGPVTYSLLRTVTVAHYFRLMLRIPGINS